MSDKPTSSPETTVDDPRKRRLFTAVWWVLLLAGIVAFRAVLVPFILASVIAYVLSPVARALCQYKVGDRHAPRWVVVLSLYLAIIAVLAVTTTVAIPALVGTVRSFVQNEVPRLSEQYRTQLAPKIRAVQERFSGKPTQEPDDGAPHEPDVRIEPASEGGYRVRLPERGIIVERDDDHDDRFRIRAPRRRRTTPSTIASRATSPSTRGTSCASEAGSSAASWAACFASSSRSCSARTCC
jgi:hypothetical protein